MAVTDAELFTALSFISRNAPSVCECRYTRMVLLSLIVAFVMGTLFWFVPAVCGDGAESQYSAPKPATTIHMEERKVTRKILKFCIAASKHSLLQY